jgi:hypothetical protein
LNGKTATEDLPTPSSASFALGNDVKLPAGFSLVTLE